METITRHYFYLIAQAIFTLLFNFKKNDLYKTYKK
jgi:hypothetical protein